MSLRTSIQRQRMSSQGGGGGIPFTDYFGNQLTANGIADGTIFALKNIATSNFNATNTTITYVDGCFDFQSVTSGNTLIYTIISRTYLNKNFLFNFAHNTNFRFKIQRLDGGVSDVETVGQWDTFADIRVATRDNFYLFNYYPKSIPWEGSFRGLSLVNLDDLSVAIGKSVTTSEDYLATFSYYPNLALGEEVSVVARGGKLYYAER